MKDHDARPDDALDAWLPGFAPGTPLADEIEAFLDETGGPVAVDEADVDEIVARLQARVDPAPVRRWGWAAGLAVAALAAAAAVAFLRPAPPPEAPPAEVPVVVAPTSVRVDVSTDALQLGDDTLAALQGDTLRVSRGVVRFVRHGELVPPATDVWLAGADLDLVPVGTVFVAGTRHGVGAIGVEEGTVRVERDGALLATVPAGGWALVADGELQAFRAPPADLSPDAAALLAELRWLTVPEAARARLRDAGALE